MATETGDEKAKRKRSPNFPGIDLGVAVEKARVLFDKEGKHPVAAKVLMKHWGYSEKSSSGLQALGAMRAFGLLDGSAAALRLTDRALAILEPGSSTARESLQAAALAPKIHAELWQEFGGNLPSEDNLAFKLQNQRGFTKGGAKEFIAQFKATLECAGLTGGTERTDIPPDEGKKFKLDPLLDFFKFQPPPPPPTSGKATMNQDTFTLAEGQVILQWPSKISPESYEDLKDWLDLMARKVKRVVHEQKAEPPNAKE